MNDRPIGVFDSGVGGLTVLSEIARLLPNEEFIYFGDTARVPYGNKSQHTVVRYINEIVTFLKQKNVKMIVIACNTASAYALDSMVEKEAIPFIDVITPVAKYIHEQSIETSTLGVIATKATVESQRYQMALQRWYPNLEFILMKACPLFVPLVEEGLLYGEITEKVITYYLNSLMKYGVTNLILGCTHYPLLKHSIQKLYPSFNLIDSSTVVAEYIKQWLQKQGMMTTRTSLASRELFFSDSSDILFKEHIPSIQGAKISRVTPDFKPISSIQVKME